MPDNNYKCKSD